VICPLLGHIDENQLHELNRCVALQAYSVYTWIILLDADEGAVGSYSQTFSSSNSDTLARQEAIIINSTHLSVNSCFTPLTFAFLALSSFLFQLFQPRKSVIIRQVYRYLQLQTTYNQWRRRRRRGRGFKGREFPAGSRDRTPVGGLGNEVPQKL